jgi:hypothetical protein
MQPHELARIKSVFGTDRIAAKARPLIQDQAIKWALDGAKSPGDFANRWEYFTRVALPEARAEVARSGLAIPRGKNLDIMAAEHVLEPAQWTQMTAKLAAREEAVQKLAGTGWVNIGEHAGADAVRANGTRLTFGSDTSAAYHVQAHYGELAPTEAAAAAASPSEQTASYVASARRTVVDGTFVGASAREGATTLTFNRKITDPVTNAVTVVETKVIVRDQYALIATHGRPLGP